MAEKINAYTILVEKLKKREHFEEFGVGGRMIINGILKKQNDKASA